MLLYRIITFEVFILVDIIYVVYLWISNFGNKSVVPQYHFLLM